MWRRYSGSSCRYFEGLGLTVIGFLWTVIPMDLVTGYNIQKLIQELTTYIIMCLIYDYKVTLTDLSFYVCSG